MITAVRYEGPDIQIQVLGDWYAVESMCTSYYIRYRGRRIAVDKTALLREYNRPKFQQGAA